MKENLKPTTSPLKWSNKQAILVKPPPPLTSQPMKPSTTSTTLLLLLSVALLAFLFLVVYPNEFHLQSLVTAAATRSTFSVSVPDPDFRLLIGILTLPNNYERRHLLRLAYALQPQPTTAVIDVRFVVCNITDQDDATLVSLEIMAYDDIIILNCPENMNNGKTYTYFSSLPSLFNNTKHYDYVMKADDDIYFRLPRLATSLNPMPRQDMYWGFVIPCDSMDPFHDYMSGMGFVMSWDLVEWISTSEIARNNTVGAEDLVVGAWLREGKKAKNRFNTKPAMYDYPIEHPIDHCSHEFVPDTIAVHRLKDHRKWARTMRYFNVTDRIRPSKFYHFR